MSGSDANETRPSSSGNAARQTQRKIISRDRGYHGCSVISGSMTGMSFYHDKMGLPVPGILHTGVPHYWRPSRRDQLEFPAPGPRFDALIPPGPETVGGFIAELGSAPCYHLAARRLLGRDPEVLHRYDAL